MQVGARWTVSNPRATLIKAKAVARTLGRSDGDPYREYRDWHIDVRAGASYVSVWASGKMVFLSMAGVPVYFEPGPWEQYLDRLFHRSGASSGAETGS
jgi:hypothetical protein